MEIGDSADELGSVCFPRASECLKCDSAYLYAIRKID